METIRLRSGRNVLVRPICSDDVDRLRAAYARLSPESQYMRFLASKPRLTRADARYLADLDGWDHFALVASPAEAPEQIIAVARFVRLPDPSVAEFAIVVGDPFQRDGLASEMLERLVDAALERGIWRFSATMLASNHAAHKLVRRLSERLPSDRPLAWRLTAERNSGSVDEIDVELVA